MADSDRKTEMKPANFARIQAVQDQIAELQKRWPAHSTPPAMLQRLDELEEELEREQAAANLHLMPKLHVTVPPAQPSLKS